ncbi:cyclic nucleotide-binding domain-containing protein [Pseudomaricurvus alkylphenolicus]|jgi:CRP-like cAMP-binding protein|uniref:cyclic nucleotide-binding domain-containing protein n=1 Tax=Pseudomaricurvus alkylphenolicus TaxID=1306991 RepID=UPI00141E60A6|nr:cyclic nucleotide-binding domain-containing protein [Pseudomaricurvus alkylphenolicus]NIB41135.1 cyclic nucleotide-binding domain-containing protein [Pseudomaricurvus alkylphenolicus]
MDFVASRLVTAEQLRPLIPFCGLLDSHLNEALDHCQTQLLCAGDRLFSKGQFDPYHYFLLSGEMHCSDQDEGPDVVRAQDSLEALWDQQPRPGNAKAAGDCVVVAIERERLDKLLTWSQVAEYLLVDLAAQRDLDEDAAWVEEILRSNLFLKMPPTNVQGIFQKLTSRWVSAGEVVIRQGELGDCCYFLKEGQARVTRHHSDDEGGTEHLADVGVGRCFGEDALLQETVRNATVTMLTDGVLQVLQKHDFLRLLQQPKVPELPFTAFSKRLLDDLTIIDVRTEGEYASGHFDRAVNIPLNLLRLKSRLLPKGKPCLVFCSTGRRSRAATFLLGQLGIDAESLRDGVFAMDKSTVDRWTDDEYVLKNGQVLPGQPSGTINTR